MHLIHHSTNSNIFIIGMAHLWNIPSDDVPEAFTEMEIETTQDPMYLEMEKMIITKGNCKCLD